jgi:glycerol-3-phosphate dehydrogenase (NAD(P)+)
MSDFGRIGIIGGGAWGTALAATVQRAGIRVRLWARESETVRSINERHENGIFLPGVMLDAAIEATDILSAAVSGADALILVIPAQHMRKIARAVREALPRSLPVVIATKGVEIATGALMGEVLAAELPGCPQAVLSGPTFAAEVARGLPTAVTLAAADPVLGSALVAALGTPSFRPYLSDDPIGCEIGGSVKNVLAIACGIVTGRGLGDNARAALITRGLAEMTRLAVAKGGQRATLMGLSGLGDLTLTCTAMQSRNCSLGAALGRGEALETVLDGRKSVAEGVDSAIAVAALARSLDVDMPIVQAVEAILHRGAAIDDEVRRLLSRPFRPEA